MKNKYKGQYNRISKKITTLLLAATLSATVLSGCGAANSASSSANSASDGSSQSDGATKVNVAYIQTGKPTSYTDENGKLTGYDVEALRLVDELLPQYEFEYVGLDQSAVYAGLATGKYQVAITNSFYTAERAEKYLFPKENIGASILGIYGSKEKNPDVKSLADAASKKLVLAPIMAGDGLYYVVDTYNKEHPDNQIELNPTDDPKAFTSAIQWVTENRYDVSIIPRQYWDILVGSEDGEYHQYFDKLNFTVFGAVKTWTILAKGEQDLADAIDTALVQLKKEGKLEELSRQFYDGVNNFEYLEEKAQ